MMASTQTMHLDEGYDGMEVTYWCTCTCGAESPKSKVRFDSDEQKLDGKKQQDAIRHLAETWVRPHQSECAK